MTEMDFHVPRWPEVLPFTHRLKTQVIQAARNIIQKMTHMKGASGELKRQHTDTIRSMSVKNMRMVDGRMGVQVDMDDNYYYQVLSDYAGLPIESEYRLVQTLSSLANVQKKYEKVRNTLTQVRLKEYGVVTPERSEIVLDGPWVIKHGNKYGVRMKAEVPPINLIKAHIETEIIPIMGSEQQTRDLIAYIKEDTGENDDGIWNTNISGKSIGQIAGDGIQAKVSQMAENCQLKLQGTLQKIINDSNDGMIYIIV